MGRALFEGVEIVVESIRDIPGLLRNEASR
jgi:hypothetical protein